MHIARAKLESLSPYSQSRKHNTPKIEKESHDAYERRTWRERLHIDKGTDQVFIPPMAFKFCIATAARYLRMRIPGKDRSEYGKHFQSGVIVVQGLQLPCLKSDFEEETADTPEDVVKGEWLSLHANGKRGSGSRVDRCMPCIPQWEGTVEFLVLDDIIEQEVFATHLNEAGNFIGIGRFRPENGGFYGRFKVTEIEWAESGMK